MGHITVFLSACNNSTEYYNTADLLLQCIQYHGPSVGSFFFAWHIFFSSISFYFGQQPFWGIFLLLSYVWQCQLWCLLSLPFFDTLFLLDSRVWHRLFFGKMNSIIHFCRTNNNVSCVAFYCYFLIYLSSFVCMPGLSTVYIVSHSGFCPLDNPWKRPSHETWMR